MLSNCEVIGVCLCVEALVLCHTVLGNPLFCKLPIMHGGVKQAGMIFFDGEIKISKLLSDIIIMHF